MLKKRKSLILIAVAAAVVLLVATAGIAFAQGGPTPGQDLLAKVAKILGIDQQKLVNAFKQAHTELQSDRLAALVKDGKITQQQADQLKAWEAKRPADPKANPQQFQEWLKSRPDISALKPPARPPVLSNEMLDKLVKDGKITQQQADQIKAWYAKRPADMKADPKKTEEWLKSRPDVPLPKPDMPRGPGLRPGAPKPPPTR